MINVTAQELDSILDTLDKALVLHDQWREKLLRTLICRLPPDPANLAGDAHLQCAFGHWYYGAGNAHLRRLDTFKALEDLHREVHDLGRQLCTHAKAHWAITPREYDPFLARVDAFRGELLKLRHKVEETLHTIDGLTGAFTSAPLLPHLRREQAAMKASGRPYSLLLLRFDLSPVNRDQGHKKGDAILRGCVTALRQGLGPEDRVYRHTGAEFVICLPGKTPDAAHVAREALLTRMSESLVRDMGEGAWALPLFYGIVPLEPDAYIEQLIAQAAMAEFTLQL
ncbi:MAG TPA: diguanylate cyclase [Thiobacillaceae bacterium]|nr:diguanylate cyclase [Thiobacillaceae bacterium]HNA82519.1 diguanylate cyclase [Thiobacillaceae bacterium]HNF88754.1 diguanylate cyclase [Thiobacillaceae bacterium]HNH88998.1 diguanylate cyclase [Thiobacillaceae bacterium]HNI07272.1 diguanylate cyclase [Thiobacillaceae bacterium]